MHETDLVTGLTRKEAAAALAAGLGNALPPRRGRSFFSRLLENLSDPVIKVLLAALCVNLLFLLRGEGWFETAGIAAAAFAAALLSTLSEAGSERAFLRLEAENARSLCRVRRDGQLLEIPAEELVEGDVVLLQAGDGVPADGILRKGLLRCDQAALSGESREAEKRAGPVCAPERWDPADPHQLFRGAGVASGEGIMQVLRVGERTLLGSMALSLNDRPPESPLRLRLTRLAKTMSRLGYGAAALVASADLFHRIVLANGFAPSLILSELSHLPTLLEHLLHAATLAVGVVIVAVPEGLPMMITVVLSRSMLRMQRDQVLVRTLTGIETAGNLNILFTDKTGTLTRGRLTVEAVLLGDGTLRERSALPELPLLWPALRESCRFNTAAQWSDRGLSGGNATDRALLELSGKEPLSPRRTRHLPFDSSKKYAACALEGGLFPCYVTGAPELLLPRCVRRLSETGPLPLTEQAMLDRLWREQAARGMRVVCLCAGEVQDGSGMLILLGLALIRDGLRPETPDALRRIAGAGVRVVMVTGDNADTARAIAAAAGLLQGGGEVLTSRQLSGMTDRQLQEILPRLRVVARALPTDKSRLVRAAQAAGLVVGMMGDGINDAPALRLADVGFAMGSGTRVAKEAGDIVILDDNIASIGRAILYGRTVFRSIRRFLVFQLTMNLSAVAVSVLGPLLGVETPITVIQMLWINMIMDTLAGLAFAGEAPREEEMRRPPYPRDTPVLTRGMLGQIAGLSLWLTGLSAAFLRLPVFRARFGWEEGGFLTAFFALFVFSGLAAAFCARTARKNLLAGLGQNRSFLAVMGFAAAVQLLLLYFGGAVFRTRPLPLPVLGQVILLALSVIPADLLRKTVFPAEE